jgi:hypothetical protein
MNNKRRHPDSSHSGMPQGPLSVNHLVLKGMNHPVLPSSRSEKQRVTVCLPTALIERLRNAVYWTGHRALVDLVAGAIEDIVTQMEEVNGEAFPQRVTPLKRGRRQGKRYPAHTTTTHSPESTYPNR